VWIDKTRDLLLGGTVETLNRLNGDITSDAAQFTVEFDAGSIVAGSIVEIGTELAYVTSVAGTTVSVMRGYGGSTAAAHTSTDIIRSNPQYPGHMILTALNDDLNDLSSPRNGLYQVATVTFTYNSTKDGYNLAADVLAVRRVTWVHTSSDRSEPEVRRFVVKRNRDTAVFASGVALILQDLPEPGQTVRVEYTTGFTALTDSTTALSVTGLHAEAYDLPAMGAALAIMSFKPIARESITQQPPMRRSEEVPPGAISASMRDLRFRRQERIQAEAARLAQQYPIYWHRSGR
jgi:hypothetical protein